MPKSGTYHLYRSRIVALSPCVENDRVTGDDATRNIDLAQSISFVTKQRKAHMLRSSIRITVTKLMRHDFSLFIIDRTR